MDIYVVGFGKSGEAIKAAILKHMASRVLLVGKHTVRWVAVKEPKGTEKYPSVRFSQVPGDQGKILVEELRDRLVFLWGDVKKEKWVLGDNGFHNITIRFKDKPKK